MFIMPCVCKHFRVEKMNEALVLLANHALPPLNVLEENLSWNFLSERR